MYLWATGAHVAKLKGKLRLLSERISDQENKAIRKAIFELNSIPQDIMFKLESIETLVSESATTEGEIYLELLGDVKRYIKPWNSYQELRNSADNKKRVEVNILMGGIDEASALPFFTTVSEALNKDHACVLPRDSLIPLGFFK